MRHLISPILLPRACGVNISSCGRRAATARRVGRRSCPWDDAGGAGDPMEFLNFLLVLVAGWLVVRRPERESLAFGLLVTSAVIMAAVFFLGTRTSVLPPFNY
jgi:hypothetical protein